MDKKQDSSVCCLQKTSDQKTESEGMEKIFHSNGNEKKQGQQYFYQT